MLRKYLLTPLNRTLETVHSDLKQLRLETAALRAEVAQMHKELREIVTLMQSVVVEMRRINQVQQQQLLERRQAPAVDDSSGWKM